MRSRRRRSRQQEQVELNVTAFMNLMVVLVPFLLILAVFSRITILELHLPKGEAGAPEISKLNLEVIVRTDGLELAGFGGHLASLPSADGSYDLKALSELLQQVKAREPEATAVTLLLEPEVQYDRLVQVMDAVRVFPGVDNGQPVQAELFPDISIGDAPARGRGT